VSPCPCGHGAGSSARVIERVTSKVVPHARHRTSYLGTAPPVRHATRRRTLPEPVPLHDGSPRISSVTDTHDTGDVPRSNRPRRAAGRGPWRGGGRRPAGGGPGERPGARPEAEDGGDLASRLLHGGGRLEEHADGAWRVRAVSGEAANKAYLCPGCRQQIPRGTPHIVAWPEEQLGGFGGPGDRRHWHTPCWGARSRRR
jgi:hypothetical protein